MNPLGTEATYSERGASQPLSEFECQVPGSGMSQRYASHLLESLGARVIQGTSATGAPRAIHPDIDWALSGAMELTGFEDGPPLLAPGPLASCARGVFEAFEALLGKAWAPGFAAPMLLGERAAVFGHSRAGTHSCGGSCRLLPASNGWIAVNLARDDDISLLPAWLGEGNYDALWESIADRVSKRAAEELVERARLLGLPVAIAAAASEVAPPWFRIAASGERGARPNASPRSPLVIDLSTLWAGPLCTELLAAAGARVIKVESTKRPDGARSGPATFFDLMNASKESAALNFHSETGREQLRALLERADIVVESARPRALAQLGFDAASIVRERSNLSWISITGYGRREPEANWVAFGDDASAAAGLATATGTRSAPVFCGDAIADPLAGMHAALAALASWLCGGSRLLDLSLREVTAHCLDFAPGSTGMSRVEKYGKDWEVCAGNVRVRVAAPSARRTGRSARSLGADTQSILEEFEIPC